MQNDGPPERGVAVLHQHHPLVVPVMKSVPVVAWMRHRVSLRPGRSAGNVLVGTVADARRAGVAQRRGLQCFQGLGVPHVLRAEVALVLRVIMGHQAVLGDPGEVAGVMFEVGGRLVRAVPTHGVETLEGAFV